MRVSCILLLLVIKAQTMIICNFPLLHIVLIHHLVVTLDAKLGLLDTWSSFFRVDHTLLILGSILHCTHYNFPQMRCFIPSNAIPLFCTMPIQIERLCHHHWPSLKISKWN